MMTQLIVATVVFYALHSALAATSVKRWAREHLGLDRWYRLVYSVISTVLLGWVLLVYFRAAGTALWGPVAALRLLGWMFMLGGSAISLFAVARFGAAGFLGLEPEPKTGLVRTGLHGHVRHPIYSGIILAMCGWVLAAPTLATLAVVLVSFGYLPFGIYLEERKLIALFGQAYVRYRKEVPAVIPGARPGSGMDP